MSETQNTIYAGDVRVKSVSEVRNVSVDMRGALDSGELLSGTPTITEVSTTDLTLASKAVSVAPLTINGQTVPTGQAVQFKVSGGTIPSGKTSKTYAIKVQCATDSSPAQTVIRCIRLKVVPDS